MGLGRNSFPCVNVTFIIAYQRATLWQILLHARLPTIVVAFLAEHGDPVTNLKLQKLLYYAQAWHLALYDNPMFDERIEAWVHGPAVPPIYGAFKGYEWQPIAPQNGNLDLPNGPKSHIDDVILAYGDFSAYQFERMMHQEDPWIKARKGLAPDEPSQNEILHEDMKISLLSG